MPYPAPLGPALVPASTHSGMILGSAALIFSAARDDVRPGLGLPRQLDPGLGQDRLVVVETDVVLTRADGVDLAVDQALVLDDLRVLGEPRRRPSRTCSVTAANRSTGTAQSRSTGTAPASARWTSSGSPVPTSSRSPARRLATAMRFTVTFGYFASILLLHRRPPRESQRRGVEGRVRGVRHRDRDLRRRPRLRRATRYHGRGPQGKDGRTGDQSR